MTETEWIGIVRILGDAGPKGDTGTGVTIKESYDSYEELIAEHPTGNEGDSYWLTNLFMSGTVTPGKM